MAIQDIWQNQLNLTSSITGFLGYRPTDEDLETFPYDMYRFIIKAIRDRDFSNKVGGSLMLQRLLKGPQEIWVLLWHKVNEFMREIWDPNLIDLDFIGGLRKLTAWGRDLEDIWVAATDDQKRKLVRFAIPFWADRWIDNGINTAIRIVTGNRFLVRDYFDFRWIVGENLMMEEIENLDLEVISISAFERFRQGDDGEVFNSGTPHLFEAASGQFTSEDVGAFLVLNKLGWAYNGIYEIDNVLSSTQVEVKETFPAAEASISWFTAFHYDEYLTEIKLVDDLTGQGAVNRDLLEKLLELQRPNSERFNLIYLTFIDEFTTLGDLGQWGTPTGDLSATVADGVMTLVSTSGYIPTNYYQDTTWTDYGFKVKAKLNQDGTIEILWFYQDASNHYKIEISRSGFGSGKIKLYKVVSGTPTQIGSDYLFPQLVVDVWWTYTIHSYVYGGTAYFSIEVDKEPILTGSASDFLDGPIALGATDGTIDIVELWRYPIDIVRIGPNP